MSLESNVLNIYPLNTKHVFGEDDAYDLVNLFLGISATAKKKINGLNSRLEYFQAQPEKADAVQMELNTEIQKWSDKMRRLGGTPIELYKVKIPTESGYYLWEFPSAEIEFIPNHPLQ